MSRTSFFSLVVLLTCFSLLATPVFAQTNPVATSTAGAAELGLPELPKQHTVGDLSCDDYYAPQQVSVSISPESESAIAGAALRFSGELKNNTSLIKTGVTVYVKMVRQDGIVVDQLVVTKQLSLTASEVETFSFVWSVPNNLAEGTYQTVVFVEGEGGQSLYGSPTTSAGLKGETRFFIEAASDTASLLFNAESSVLNGKPFSHLGQPVFVQENEVNTVSVSITNSGTEAKTVPVQWNQYATTPHNDAFRRNTKTALVTVNVGETKVIPYTIKNQAESALYITATVAEGQTKSTLSFDLRKHGGDEIVLLSSGLTNFGDKDAHELTVFACVEATSKERVSGASVTLTLKDKIGNVVAAHTYSSDIIGQPTGIGKLVSVERSEGYYTLTTAISVDGKITKEVTQIYDCTAIDQTTCPQNTVAMSFFDVLKTYTYYLLGLALLMLGGLCIWLRKRRQSTFIVAGLLLIAGITMSPLTTEAKTVSWNSDLNTAYPDYTLDTSVTYSTTIRNITSGNAIVTDGSAVTVGDQLSITVGPFSDSDIRWTPEGSSGPYLYPSFTTVNGGTYRDGYFAPGATLSGGYCSSANVALHSTANTICIGHSFWGSGGPGDGGGTCFGAGSIFAHLLPLAVAPPTYQITLSGTALLSCNSDNTACTVTTAGTIAVQVTFDSTTLNMYHKVADAQVTSCANSVYLGGYPPTTEYMTYSVPSQTIGFSFTAAGLPVNNPPNPPTITGATTGNPNVSYPFTFTATDLDNDQIYYEVDWNNDGSVDQRVPGSGLVNSGAGQSANYSWATVGSKTFRARTADVQDNRSGWATHTITLAVLPATADLKIDNSDGPLVLNAGSAAVLSWSSTNAASCTIYGTDLPSGALTGQAAIGSYTISSVTNSDNYVVVCDGVNDQASLTVVNTAPPPTTNRPNFTQPIIRYTPSTGFNLTTGMYDSVEVTFQTTNFSESDTTTNANYSFEFDRANGLGVDTSGSMGLLNIDQSFSGQETVLNVPFGPTRIRVEVDTPLATNGNVDESNETDNYYELSFSLPPPNPNIELNADRLLVRSGEKVTLTWNTKVTFPMSCSVFGPGITTVNFDPSINGATGSKPSEPIKAKSEFTLSCVVAGTTFTDSVTIETQGVIEEI